MIAASVIMPAQFRIISLETHNSCCREVHSAITVQHQTMMDSTRKGAKARSSKVMLSWTFETCSYANALAG